MLVQKNSYVYSEIGLTRMYCARLQCWYGIVSRSTSTPVIDCQRSAARSRSVASIRCQMTTPETNCPEACEHAYLEDVHSLSLHQGHFQIVLVLKMSIVGSSVQFELPNQ